MEQRVPVSLRVLECVLEERPLRGAHDRDRAEPRLPLRAAEEDRREPLADVAAANM